MNTGDVIFLTISLVLCAIAFIINFFQFKEKGFLFNNAYLYASKKERETMNKRPYYRQSAIVFLLLGIAFLLLATAILFAVKWLCIVIVLLTVCMIIYAIQSSIHIEKNKCQCNKNP